MNVLRELREQKLLGGPERRIRLLNGGERIPKCREEKY